MVDEFVLNVLRKAIEQDTEIRLVAIGDDPSQSGLFTDHKAKKSIQACIQGEKPVLSIRRELPGKGAKKQQFVQITEQGISTLVAQTPLPLLPELIAAAAPLLRTKVIRRCLRSLARRAGEHDPWKHRRLIQECLKAAQTQFALVEARLQETLNEDRALVDSIDEFIKAMRTRFDRQKLQLEAELASLSKAASLLVSTEEAGVEGQPKRLTFPDWQRVPLSEADIEFQKNLSQELIFAWQDTDRPEIRASLERALFNVGVERITAPGEVIRFDGSLQHSDDEVNEGDPVEVLIPGWQLVNPRGTFLLARAKVAKSSRSSSPERPIKEGTATPSSGGSGAAPGPIPLTTR